MALHIDVVRLVLTFGRWRWGGGTQLLLLLLLTLNDTQNTWKPILLVQFVFLAIISTVTTKFVAMFTFACSDSLPGGKSGYKHGANVTVL